MSGQNVIGLNEPNSYRLISCVISNNEGRQWDVTDQIDSFEITESIYQMFITGSATFVENNNVFNRINFTGQEYIRLHFSGIKGMGEERDEEEQVNQIYRIYSIPAYARDTQTDLSKVLYSVQFCSPLLYEARTKRLSQHFTGTNGQIIDKICTEHLNFEENNNSQNTSEPLVKGGKELGNVFNTLADNVGSVKGFLCPNWTIHKALKHLRDHCEDDSESAMPYGNSYYFYQTATQGFRFHNISSMMNIKYLNGGRTFEVRDSELGIKDDFDDIFGIGSDILNYNKSDMYNTIAGHNHGLYASHILNYDTVNKQITDIDFEFTQQFKLDDEGFYEKPGVVTISKAPPFRLADESIRIPQDDQVVGEGIPLPIAPIAYKQDSITKRHNAAIHFDYNTPHKFSLLDNNTTTGSAHCKTNRERVEALLTTNRINVMISGRTNITCGMMIKVDIAQPTLGGGFVSSFDQNDFLLIESVTWRGSAHGLECHLSCTTDGFQKQIEVDPEPDRTDGDI